MTKPPTGKNSRQYLPIDSEAEPPATPEEVQEAALAEVLAELRWGEQVPEETPEGDPGWRQST